MTVRFYRVSSPVAAALLLAATTLGSAQQPAVKAAPQRLVLTTAVPAARAVLDSALLEVENVGGRRADAFLRRAVELDASAGLSRAVYANAASDLSQAERTREVDRALVDATRASTPELLAVISMRDWIHGDARSALAVANAARSLLPDDPFFAVAAFRSGATLGGDVAERLAAEEAFLERNPDVPGVLNAYGYDLYRAGRPEKALEVMRHYVAVLPDHPNSHDSYGEILQRSGRLDEAEQQYRRSLEVDPAYAQAYTRLAGIAQMRHDYAGAQAQVEVALAHAQSPTERITAQRAVAFNALFAGDRARARAMLAAAATEADRAGMTASAYWSRAYLASIEAVEGDREAALRDLETANATRDPYNAYWAAAVHGALGDATATHADLEALERAAEQDPSIAKEAVRLTRVIDAAAEGNLGAARGELAGMTDPAWRLVAQGFLLRAARRSGDTDTARAAEAEIAAYTAVDGPSAYVHDLVRRN